MLIGFRIYGTTIAQTVKYFRLYPSDRPFLKIFVCRLSHLLLIMTMLILTVHNQVVAILYVTSDDESVLHLNTYTPTASRKRSIPWF